MVPDSESDLTVNPRAPAAAPPSSLGRRDRRREVIDAAIDVFWRKGFSAASIQDVADKVGVLKGSLYHYIDSKEDLLFKIFDESHDQASAIVVEVAALDAPPLVRLQVYVERYLEWYLLNVERVSVYFREWRHLTTPRLDIVRKQRDTFEAFVRDLLREAQTDGDVDAELDVTSAAFFVLGALNGAPDWYRRDGAVSAKAIAAEYGRLAVHMVASGDRKPKAQLPA